ncbi:AAA family ATPase [Kitasatospora sp. NPDC006697]|uniref:helix-turn-helix transcriptional regulator n=1 Tax=Kitasatospora sp. NPDC006697 TaxID=3364020 RepID=UPI0036941C2E
MAGLVAQVLGGGPGGHFAFVGRRREQRLLAAALRHPPAVVLVEGEAGVGKSRLVHQAGTDLAEGGWTVVTGYCHPLREPSPYGPVADSLRKLVVRLPEGTGPGGALAQLLTGQADPAAGPDTPGRRLAIVQAVRSLLDAAGPVVLVIEDLHWADEATRDLLLLLARDMPRQLSLLLTYRAEDLAPDTPALGAAYRHPPGTSGTTVPLAPLSRAEIAELAGSALGTAASPELCRVLHQRSDGLPLVAEEDLITLRERAGDRTHLPSATALASAEVPRGLREAVTERLAPLSAAGDAIVAAAAVLDLPATEELLADVAGLAREEGADGLTEALRASVLQEEGEGQYGFRHGLARQVAYERLAGPRRTALHRAAVEQLSRRTPVPLVQVAHHTLAAGDRRSWFRRAEEAANQATAVGDTGTATMLLQQILEQPGLAADLRSRAALALAVITVRRPDHHPANETVLRRILADPQLPRETRGEIRMGLALAVVNIAGDRAGIAELELAAEELKDRPERAARAMISLAMDEKAEPGRAQSWLELAEETVRRSSDEVIKTAALATRLTLLARRGDPAVWPMIDALAVQSEDIEVLWQDARARYNVGEIAIELGHPERAALLSAQSRHLAERAGNPAMVCGSELCLLRLDLLAGRWADLDERIAELVTGYPDYALVTAERRFLQGHLAYVRGQYTKALRQFTNAAAYGEKNYEVSVALRAAAGRAAVRLRQEAPGDGWAIAAPAVELVRRTGAWARATGLLPAAVAAALGDGRRTWAEELVAEAGEQLAGRDTPAGFAELHFCEGLLSTDPKTAAERFGEAAEGWQRIGRPYHAAEAREQQGLALVTAGPEQAARHLADARDACAALGATATAGRCQQALREHGLSTPPVPQARRGFGDQLSPREQEVVALLGQGATNHEIAAALVLSPRTVEQHVANALRKLGTSRKSLRAADGD